jgi:hypothetical protein
MKKLYFTSILISFFSLNTIAQQVPVFIGTTYENTGAMGADQIQTWNYKGYVFITSTPGIARPVSTTCVYKKSSNGLAKIKNNELFGKNVPAVIEIVNSKLKSAFSPQKKEDPKCYKEFYPVGINELSISVDNNYMYFEMTWDSSYTSDNNSQCFHPCTVARINLTEISSLIQPTK